ncbi:hypothetical protein [Pseudonocardia xishanensis]|uniref:Arrestin-like N-terminal domain-containing protein n=1 Tax=Pseudonocardia xishanensis TaxID=630995 RepID=A0ABP8RN94_9PSEU
MIFGRRGPTLAVDIRTDRDAYRPGEIVRATVRLTPSADLESPEVSVALLHADTAEGWSDSWAVDGRFVVEEESMRGGVTVEHVVELRVPERATPGLEETGEPLVDDPEDFRHDLDAADLWGAPSSTGRRVRSTWAVQVVGRGTGKPVDERRPVTVLALPARGRPGTRSRGPADVAVTIPDGSVAPGATVSGRLRVTPERELAVRSLRVDLLLVERLDDRVLTADRVVSVPLAAAETLPARVPRDLPFALTVPPDAAPTALADGASIRWELHGVVDLARREDAVGVHELVVHSAGL